MKFAERPSCLICVMALSAICATSINGAHAERDFDMKSRGVLGFRPLNVSLGCLSPAALRLLDRIETQFGSIEIVSTCRPGAVIAGTSRPSLHGSGNAIDFNAGSRKGAIIEWLIANHPGGGTMTYPDMDHIHVDIGRHFVSLAGGGNGSGSLRTKASPSADRPAWSRDDQRMSLGAH